MDASPLQTPHLIYRDLCPFTHPRGGGALGYLLRGYVPSGTYNLDPVLTESALNLIPRSGKKVNLFIPRSRRFVN